MANDDGENDELVLSSARVIDLICNRRHLLVQPATEANAINDDVTTHRFLVQHLETVRAMASSESVPVARISQYACNSAAVMGVLLMLSDMFS